MKDERQRSEESQGGSGSEVDQRRASGQALWAFPMSVVAGVVVSLLAGMLLLMAPVREDLGALTWVLAVIGIAGLAGLIGSWRYRSCSDSVMLRERRELERMRREVDSEMAGLEARRQRFERRLLSYGEFMEFPDRDTAPAAQQPEQAAAVRTKDEAVARIIRERSEAIFEGFRGDAYLVDGKFSVPLLMKETADFIEEIARVYQPGATDPLLETNVEKLLQAINRLSMQMLFQIEQLPLNLKDYSLARIAEHVRTASRFLGYYQTLQPYLPIANYTWQIGRVVAGANPLAAGTVFLGSEALRRGGRKIGKLYLERYSLKLTQEAVRLLGNEVATVFDPGYRYRDSSWVYAVELAELVHVFAPSIQTLQAALQEIGSLPLHGSYDRVYLYRCLAAHLSPQPEKFTAIGYLSSTERHEIARRLEAFFTEHAHGRHPERTRDWARAVEERLGVALRVAQNTREIAPVERALGMVQALAGFLVEIHGFDPDAVADTLQQTRSWQLWRGMSTEQDAPADSAESWPSLFDYPEIAGDAHLLRIFFDDLVALAREAEAGAPAALVAISEAARFLGMPDGQVEETLVAMYARRLGTRLGQEGAGESRLPGSLAAALLVLLSPGEEIDFLYPAEFAGRRSVLRGTALHKARLWLVGAGRMLWLLGEPLRAQPGALPGSEVVIGWAGRADQLSFEMDDRGRSIVLSGGHWHVPVASGMQAKSAAAVGIRVPVPGEYPEGNTMSVAARYLRALLACTVDFES